MAHTLSSQHSVLYPTPLIGLRLAVVEILGSPHLAETLMSQGQAPTVGLPGWRTTLTLSLRLSSPSQTITFCRRLQDNNLRGTMTNPQRTLKSTRIEEGSDFPLIRHKSIVKLEPIPRPGAAPQRESEMEKLLTNSIPLSLPNLNSAKLKCKHILFRLPGLTSK